MTHERPTIIAAGPWILRRATLADVEALLAVQRAAYARNRHLLGVEPIPLQADYHAVLADPAKETWLADGEAGLAGALVLEWRDDDLMIESIATDPTAQGGGLGRALLRAALQRAADEGRAVVRLYTGSPLAHLIAWYGRHGFVVERIETLPDRSITHMVRR